MEVVDDLMAFLAGAEVIIHNASFDVGFLDAELRRLGRPAFAAQVGSVTDSLTMARSMFPGKSNSLDALCRRLEVDNSSRTLHGALLDAELLAEVYIRMTRGQKSLAMEAEASRGASSVDWVGEAADVDLSSYALPLCEVSDVERQAHETVLSEIDKASGLALWKKMMA